MTISYLAAFKAEQNHQSSFGYDSANPSDLPLSQ